MRILITNDDGIDAVGINVLANIFCEDNDVIVIAPSTEKSACSHSLTIHSDLVYKQISGRKYKAFSLSGTPADCVKFGVLRACQARVDLVIAGINNGSNLGSDIMYSGTVGASMDAIYLGVPSISLSLAARNCDEEKYVAAAKFLHDNLRELLLLKMPPHAALNINFPAELPYKGVKATKAGINLYDDTFIDGETHGSIRLVGSAIEHGKNEPDCDVEWCKNGYVTVSPISIDRNDYDTLKRIKSAKVFD